jgi:hypothetical protein
VWQTLAVSGAYLPLAGGTVTGALTVEGLATHLSGTSLFGPLYLSGSAGASGQVLTSAGVDDVPIWQTPVGGSGAYLPLTGGTVQGTTTFTMAPGQQFTVGTVANGTVVRVDSNGFLNPPFSGNTGVLDTLLRTGFVPSYALLTDVDASFVSLPPPELANNGATIGISSTGVNIIVSVQGGSLLRQSGTSATFPTITITGYGEFLCNGIDWYHLF